MVLWNLLHNPVVCPGRDVHTRSHQRCGGPAKQSVLGQGRKDRAGDQRGRGPGQALDLCKKSIKMSPALRVQRFISVQGKFVLFSAFPRGCRVKRCSEISLFLKLRLFKEELKLIIDQLVWLRGKGSTRGEEL